MGDNLELIRASHVVLNKSEMFGITCLAIIGAVSIINTIAQSSYRLGAQEKEREMKRELKKCRKKFRKENGLW